MAEDSEHLISPSIGAYEDKNNFYLLSIVEVLSKEKDQLI